MNVENISAVIAWLSVHTLAVLKVIWAAMNSGFAIALIGAFAGAFAGALGAQRIAEHSRRRNELLKELRNTNAATMVAVSVCNAALAVKRQHVQPFYEQFMRDKEILQTHLQQRAAGQVQGSSEFHFTADLKVFPAPEVPIETLKDLVFHRISAYGRPLAIVSVLEQSIVGLKSAISKRDQLIQHFTDKIVSANDFPFHYFGLPLGTGHTHQEYPDIVEAIHNYLDDVVFFSSLLSTDLISHGNGLYAAFKKQFGKGAPKVSIADFSRPCENGLMPPDTAYTDWLSGFKEHDTGKTLGGGG